VTRRKALGIKKDSDKPSREKVEEFWSTDTYEARNGMFLQISVPLSVDPCGNTKFLKNVLAPACVKGGCTN
jgi:hypothetical protein